jgi:phage terminase large subunit
MQVSRDYIETGHIVDFPVTDRFLKLPIENFLEVEGIDPIAPQIAMINAINDPRHRQVIGCLSRRTGKTYISNVIAFLKAMEPGSTVLIVSPNYSLTGISWREQEAVLKRHGIEVKSKNKTDKEIHLENGSIIKFGSVSQADSLVGRSYDLILFDECALDGKGGEAYNIQLRPTLDKVNSKVIFISTPRGSNYFKEFYERGMSDDYPSWASIHSTWEDNPRMTKVDVQEAKRSMSRAEFEQEYCASFVTMEGQVYDGFDFEECVQDFDYLDLDEYCDRIMGIDPGYRDSTGAVLVYYSPDDDKFYCVWDYCQAGKNTKIHADHFKPIIDQHEVDMIFVDSAAAQFRVDLVSLYDIPSNNAKKSRLDGISYVQSLVEQDKLIVHKECEHVIEMLVNYRWDPNENLTKPKPIHDEYSHVADALRYALYSLAR